MDHLIKHTVNYLIYSNSCFILRDIMLFNINKLYFVLFSLPLEAHAKERGHGPGCHPKLVGVTPSALLF